MPWKEPWAQTEVELALELLQVAEKTKAGEAFINEARRRLDEARATRDSATPPDKMRVRIERKVKAKENSLAQAREEEQRCKEAIQQATTALEKASGEAAQRLQELESLQVQLQQLPEVDEFNCEGEDERLEHEFRGNVEVVRLHRQFEAAQRRLAEAKDNAAAGRSDASQPAPRPTGAKRQSEEAITMEVEGLDFEGDDFDNEDLATLGIAPDGSEGSAAKIAKLADWFQVQAKKRITGKAHRETGGGCVRARICKA
jgi:hypothetical protein